LKHGKYTKKEKKLMNEDRRAFIKKASLLSGATGFFSVFPEAIQKALAIDASAGSTYMDAEHVVFLMQENRSFDHCFGTLKGVRGFNEEIGTTTDQRLAPDGVR